MAEEPRPRRADAERNREGLLDAAARCLAGDSRASMGEIATAAGVSRITMYGHFANRSELIEAVFTRSMHRADQSLAELDLTGDAWTALQRLVEASWQIVAASRLVLRAAVEELGPEAVRGHHGQPFARIERLVRRGRKEGAFRTDLPETWLTTCLFSVIHAAADDLAAGRISARTAQRVVWPTVASVFRPPPAMQALGP